MRTWRVHLVWTLITLFTAIIWGNFTARRAARQSQESPPSALPRPAEQPPTEPGILDQIKPLNPPAIQADSQASVRAESSGPEEIRRLLATSSPGDWQHALNSIQKLTDPKVKLDLLKLASKIKDDWVMHRVIVELGLLGGPEAGEVLIQILKSDSKGWIKERAAGWIGNTGGTGALEALLDAYHSDSFYLQVAAAGSLHKLGHPGPTTEMLPKIGVMFENPDGAIRRDAIEQLGHLAVAEALPLLTRALQDSNGDVRIEAIRVLRQGTIPGAVPLVEKMLADPNPDVVHEAQRTLAELRDASKNDPK